MTPENSAPGLRGSKREGEEGNRDNEEGGCERERGKVAKRRVSSMTSRLLSSIARYSRTDECDIPAT